MKPNYTAIPLLFTLLAFILASLLGAAAFAQPACDPGFTDDDTIAADTDVDDDNDGLIEICDLNGLDHVRHNLAGTSYKESSSATENTTGCPTAGCTGYELTEDLDFTDTGATGYNVVWTADDPAAGSGWPPIGGVISGTGLAGDFEGNGYNIRNLYIKGGSTLGLFRTINSGTEVRNLGLLNVNVSGTSGIGPLAGSNKGTVSGCHSSGDLRTIGGFSQFGGLLGGNGGMVTDCHASVNIDATQGGANRGGLIGLNESSGSVTRCYATGNLDGTGIDSGGLIGNDRGGTITSCYATGSVGGSGANRGGLVGTSSGTISSSYSTGAVSGASDGGGLLGVSGTAVTLSYWDTQTSGKTTSGGGSGAVGKTTDEMKALTTGAFGTNDSDWDFGDNTQYPALKKGGSTTVAGQPCPRALCYFGGGTGTDEDPYQISSIEGLDAIRGDFLGGHYILMNDLDFEDTDGSGADYVYSDIAEENAKGWLPIGHDVDSTDNLFGSSSVAFTGSFDGQGHVISNLRIRRTGMSFIGLFGGVSSSGSIANLGVVGLDVTGKNSVGGIAGQCSGCDLSSSYTTGLLTGRSGGGLVGAAARTTISSCYSTAEVLVTISGGGLVGNVDNATIQSCYFAGDARVSGVVRGLVGQSLSGTITSSYWENANAADTDDATDVTAGDLKMFEVNNFGARASDWDVGNDGQYPALKHDGSLICGQPSPRAYCEPPVQIASATAVTEGGTAMFTLTRWATFEDRATALTVTVSVTGGAGFIGTPSPNVMFAATSREATYSVPTEGDTMDEADGRITVTITDATTDYSVEQGQGSATAEVMDDDLPVVSITGGASVIEGEAAEFTVTRVGNTTEALTVMVDVTQTGDFLTSTTSPVAVEILADQATATLSVDTEDDDGDEPDGMITATMPVSASTYRLGTATATVDVMDNDVVPPAPADLTAPSTDTTSVSLTWTAVAADPPVTGYQVKVSDGAGTTVITDWTDIVGSTVATASHTVTGLTALTAYTFTIRAQNAAGDGEAATVEATTLALPGAPTALMAGTPTSTTVPLTWTVATTGGDATAFQFKVSNAAGTAVITDWTDIMNSDATTSSYTVTGLMAETAYTFAIRAQNSAGESAEVMVTATTAAAPTTPPTAPSGLLAPAAGTTSTSVGLTWTAAATDADISAYQVKVSSAAAGATGVTGWTNIMESSVTTTSYTVTGLTAETTYTFAIRAKNTAGDGEAATIDATTTAVEPPGAPTALMAGTPTSTTVPLTWTVATTGEAATSFQFKVSNADGMAIITDWTDIMNSDATTASYTVTGLTAETVYTFAIRAKNTAGESAGVTATATTATAPTTPPATPSGLLAPAAETTSTSVELTWTAAATDADISAYQVQVSNADGMMVITAWMNILGSSVTTTSYTVTGLTAETAYTFAIRAKNTAGESDKVTVTATTKAASATLSFGGETIDNQTYTEDTEIPPLTLPEATGGTGPYTYNLTPVPAGLEFDAGTRILSGMPTMATDTATTHTYTVTDTATTLTAALMFKITVNAAGTFGIGSQGSAVHVYPNPAGDVLHIEFPGAGDYGIALLTVTGQQVFGGQQVGGGTRKLDVSTLKGGVYFLKIEDSEGVSKTFRIIL